MAGLFADLHVHSFYSDGSMSPDEIVEAALKSDVGVLAVADHDLLEGSLAVRKLCKKNGIVYIPAVEIDSLENGKNFHILAYGFDVHHKEFRDFLSHTRFLLDEASVRLIEAMQSDYGSLSLADFMDFAYDIRLGGWKALHYFVKKGLTASLKEGIQFYPRYHITYDKFGYSSIRSIVYRIKKAGGFSVLAHPGETIGTDNMNDFYTELHKIMSCGLEGIECYYPTHSDAVTKACLDYCKERGLLITAGSDCHGLFGKTRVGEMDVPLHKLSLGKLMEKAL